jgi:general secretion pathway protein J
VILLASLSFGLKAWERGTTHTDRVDHTALVQNLLRRAIEDAYPLFLADNAMRGHVAFEGTADSLRWLSSTPAALAGSGRSWWSVTLTQGRNGPDLVVAATPELANASDAAAKNVLLANVAAVELAYFGKGRSDKAAAWREQWTGETALPQLVRVMVRFPPGDGRVWPKLLIGPRVGADVGCVYDPLTKQCRGR